MWEQDGPVLQLDPITDIVRGNNGEGALQGNAGRDFEVAKKLKQSRGGIHSAPTSGKCSVNGGLEWSSVVCLIVSFRCKNEMKLDVKHEMDFEDRMN